MRSAFILSAIFLVSCSSGYKNDLDFTHPTPTKHEFEGRSVNVEHTRYFLLSSTSGKSRNTQFLEQIDFIPVYVGQKRSLVKIYPEGDYHTIYHPDWYNGPETPDIKVYVDANQTLNNIYQREFDKSIGRYRAVLDSSNHTWHPVYLYSSDADTVSIGYDFSLDLFMEVLDIDGKWKSIHHPRFPGCGVGKYQIVLPPNQYAITTVPKYEGNFKTKARLKLYRYKNIYSNTFEIEINESQFKPQPGNEFALKLIDWIFYRRR